jgi:uncharacterized protein with HEPN domain
MPSKEPRQRLLHIRHSIHLAQSFVAGLDSEAFSTDVRTVYAVVRCLEIISEASRRLPDEMKARYPDIPWSDMAGAGNIYRHDYEDVRERLVWATVQNRFPALLAVVEAELERASDL